MVEEERWDTSMSSRETQFATFAELLWKDLDVALSFNAYEVKDKRFQAHLQKIIAIRAYDLVEHTCTEIEQIEDFNEKFWMGRIPDMTTFPEVP
jgi:hypothetical protein